MAENIKVVGTDSLKNAITEAQNALNKAFGSAASESGLEGESAYRFLNIEALSKAYSKNIDIKSIFEILGEPADSVARMRSSYMPIELFKAPDNTLSESIGDTVSKRESFENAFFRMLGLPSAEDDSIASASDIIYITPDGDSTGTIYETIENEVLNVRETDIERRRVLINNNLYDLYDSSEECLAIKAEAEANLEDSVAIPSADALDSSDEIKARITPKITNIHENIFNFCYLLIPPIQDYRFSNCINESEKIVAKPFSPRSGRIVNSKKIKPSLLESIIRIRLDKLSGTDINVSSEPSDDALVSIEVSIEIGDSSIDESEVTTNSFGILESLFILRLNASIIGMAKKLDDAVEDAVEAMTRPNKRPSETNPGSPNCGGEKKLGDGMGDNTVDSPSDDDSIINKEKKALEEQLLIEDSILVLLGDKSNNTIDLQSQTQRSSSVYDSHMMSNLIGIIDLPRKYIASRLEENKDAAEKISDIDSENAQATINTLLGVSKGIGAIDVAVFSLALFTIPEKYLLGLLSNKAYDLLKNGEFSELIPDPAEKEDTALSVNELTKLIIGGYQLFQREASLQEVDDSERMAISE